MSGAPGPAADISGRRLTPVVFIQGGGDGAHVADRALASSLQAQLDTGCSVRYPKMPNEADPSYDAWRDRIAAELDAQPAGAVLVAHSVGGTILLRYLAENGTAKPIRGTFLVAIPFCGTGGWHIPGMELPKDSATRIAAAAPIFFYHNRDDDVVPFDHLGFYRELFPQSTIRASDTGGHQFNNDLSEVARDIKNLP